MKMMKYCVALVVAGACVAGVEAAPRHDKRGNPDDQPRDARGMERGDRGGRGESGPKARGKGAEGKGHAPCPAPRPRPAPVVATPPPPAPAPVVVTPPPPAPAPVVVTPVAAPPPPPPRKGLLQLLFGD